MLAERRLRLDRDDTGDGRRVVREVEAVAGADLDGLLAVLSPEFMAPYDTFWGQVVLGIAGVLFAGAVWGLIQLSRPVAEPRVLGGVEAGGVNR